MLGDSAEPDRQTDIGIVPYVEFTCSVDSDPIMRYTNHTIRIVL